MTDWISVNIPKLEKAFKKVEEKVKAAPVPKVYTPLTDADRRAIAAFAGVKTGHWNQTRNFLTNIAARGEVTAAQRANLHRNALRYKKQITDAAVIDYAAKFNAGKAE